MATEFTIDLQNPNPSFSEMNSSNIELLLNTFGTLENLNTNAQTHQQSGLIMPNFCPEHYSLLHRQPQIPLNDIPNSSAQSPVSAYEHLAMQFLPSNGGSNSSLTPESEIMVSSSMSRNGLVDASKANRNIGYGGKKRKRGNEREMEKPREVVHVRAKRGQATDSHSLAERLRREKINEKLRCLQDLVPGCYKTMGMAVMLDVIINYVRSLQNQIDFLSMKLSTASLFYDFNSSEAEAIETMQGTNGYEAHQGMEKLVEDQSYGGFPHFQPSNWSL